MTKYVLAPAIPQDSELRTTVPPTALHDGNSYTRLRDELGTLYEDRDFAGLFPDRGQPALAPWRLAMVTLMQFLEDLSDRRAADAVRSRIDWKYALGLELTDPGFDFSALCEFRARLIAGGSEKLLLDKMLQRLRAPVGGVVLNRSDDSSIAPGRYDRLRSHSGHKANGESTSSKKEKAKSGWDPS